MYTKNFESLWNSMSTLKEKERSRIEHVSPAKKKNINYFTLFRYATKRDIFSIFIAIIFAIIGASMVPLNMLIFGKLIQAMTDYGKDLEKGAKPDDEHLLRSIHTYAIHMMLYGMVLGIAGYLETTLINIPTIKQIYRIRQEYLKAVLNQDLEYFDVHRSGDFASKVSSDIIKLEEGMGEKLTTFIYFIACFVNSVITALMYGWKLALICLSSVPVSMSLLGIIGLVTARFGKKESVARAQASEVAEEVLASIRTVYAFSGQRKEKQRYNAYLQQVKKMNIKKDFYNGILMGLMMTCIIWSFAFASWFAFQFMINEPETYDANTVLAVMNNVLAGSVSFGMAASLVDIFGTATGVGSKIYRLIDKVPVINPRLDRGIVPSSIEGNIEFKNVVFNYPSRRNVLALRGVNITVKKGQTVAVLGRTGSGKSTIMHLIPRFYDVLDGQVLLDGRDVRDLSVRWLRAQIGMVDQEPVLFNKSVRENIAYGRKRATNEEIIHAAKTAYAHNFIMRLPNGYDTLVGEGGASMSGGQKQRIAIARALIRDPAILLLDEATSALDVESEASVHRALCKAAEGRTTIIVAHRLTTVRDVDFIYVLNNGIVQEMGSHDELMKKKGQYYDLVMMDTLTKAVKTGVIQNDPVSETELPVTSTNDENEDEYISSETSETLSVVEKEPEEDESVPFLAVTSLILSKWLCFFLATVGSLLNGFIMPITVVIFTFYIEVTKDIDDVNGTELIESFMICYVVVGIFGGIFLFIQVFLFGVAGACLTKRLRQLMFSKYLEQEIGFFDDKGNSPGALCARLSAECSYVRVAISQKLGITIQAISTYGLSVLIAMLFEWRMGLISLCFSPIVAMILYREARMITSESSGSTDSLENTTKIAIQAINNMRTVSALGQEGAISKEYSNGLKPVLKLAIRASHCRGIVIALSRCILNFLFALTMMYGGSLIVDNGVPFTKILGSNFALLLGATSATQFFSFASNFEKCYLAVKRIIILLKRETKISDPSTPVSNFIAKGEVTLKDVAFTYPTRPMYQVLNGFNLDVGHGKVCALVGNSGSGKSTVLQLIERYYDPDKGTVCLDNIPLPKLSLLDARGGISFVQQEPVLFDRTIQENIAYGDNSREPTIEEIIDVAEQANIHSFITTLPLGYNTNLGSGGIQLSGGQKQQVAIARALMRNPKILLLDEATSALDTQSEKVVQEALDKAKAGRTCITIAHRLSTIIDSDMICMMRSGTIAEQGTHQELMDAKGLYYMFNQHAYS